MNSILLRQLLAVRNIILPDFERGTNCFWQIGITLNSIRDAMLKTAPTEERELIMQLCTPIEVEKPRKGQGEYIVKSSDALRLCDQLISFSKSQTLETQEESSENIEDFELERIIPFGKRVFVVHGHDMENLFRLRSFLKDRLDLEPVILSEQPDKGRTIVEKFEQEAKKCGFAFILFTPDDLVTSSSGQKVQARPNVLFEIGWFYGRLGRDRVCILCNMGTAIPTDLEGIARISFRSSVGENIAEIERELFAAGFFAQEDQ